MSALFDIIIVIIIIFCTAFGYKNGFIRTIMNFLSFLAAFFMARTFAPYFSDYLYASHIKPGFVSAASEQLEKFLTQNIDLKDLADNAAPPDNFISMLRGYGFDLPDVQAWLREAGTNTAENIKEFVASNLVEPLAKQFSYFLAFIIILAAALILLKIAVNIIDSLVKLPGLNFMNKTGGIMLGLVYGIAVCYIFVFLASHFMPYLAANRVIDSWIDTKDGTIFFKWLYENSPLESILGWF
ncbi:MAG: CvpA family protein [Oscillospiraceae bacterium]|nr:CvpA family protein [Oscillospiraceae bacterium]